MQISKRTEHGQKMGRKKNSTVTEGTKNVTKV